MTDRNDGVRDLDDGVRDLVGRVLPERRRRDAETLLALMTRATGQPARLWGSLIGFGAHHYRYASGREGDTPAVAFAPRKAASTLYLMDGVDRYAERLAQLGPHTTGRACLYLTDLSRVDVGLLEEIVAESYRRVLEQPSASG